MLSILDWNIVQHPQKADKFLFLRENFFFFSDEHFSLRKSPDPGGPAMSLYPPSPRHPGQTLHAGDVLDVLATRFGRWVSFVHACRVGETMRHTEISISAFRRGIPVGNTSSLGLPLVWKHWVHFVGLRKRGACTTRWLVHHVNAVVAFKAWRVMVNGRLVIHDQCVVTAFKHWHFLWRNRGARNRAKADAFRETIVRRNRLRSQWEDEQRNNAHRKKYDSQKRRDRLDALYGLDPVVRVARFPNQEPHCFTCNAGHGSDRWPVTVVHTSSNTRPTRD